MISIPENFHDLLKDETRAYAYLGTIMSDGSPQVTPVWFNVDGDNLLINSAVGRVKDKNMRRDNRVTLTIADPKNMYRYIQARGKIIEIDEANGRAHINALAKKYRGLDLYPGPAAEQRVRYRIQIEHCDAHG
jgi:PPOX class probable F420-dependent enzyme